MAPSVEIRTATPDDRPAIMALLEATLGWVPDAHHEAFFQWKHHENPFGPSPSWVAVDGARIVGFRTFLRWEFSRAGEVVRAGRAVDTATHPDYQGLGIFTRLTQRALADCEAEGLAFVFNTPNDQSRPGYLKMGWQEVGRVRARARFRSPWSLIRAARARVPADKWSEPCAAGKPAGELFADRDGIDRLLGGTARQSGIQTRRSSEYLAWRYGFGPLAYRGLELGDAIEDGIVVVRTRRRGGALELAVADVLVPPGRRDHVAAAVRAALRMSQADYAISIGGRPGGRHGFVPLPRQGPVFTWRHVTETRMPPLHAWALTLGDVELF
jgi:GNAT superfamily N-acetyltransferase